jgi:tRNA threonylcarbamoyladenosine biosynthesis protein TsaB
MIEHLLKLTDTDLSQVDTFAVVAGPGSFTGLRIGVATVKGLAFSFNKPCIAVSALEALAYQYQNVDGILCPVIDARRNHVYNAIFAQTEGKIQRLTPDRLISIEDLLKELNDYAASPVHLLGNAAQNVKKQANQPLLLGIPKVQRACAEAAAIVAATMSCDIGFCHDTDLSPIYLRPTQAERERLEKEKENTL